MNYLKYTILFFAGLLMLNPVSAQKRVQGYPEVFADPQDPFDQNKYESFIQSDNIRDKDNKRAWWVVVDRDGVKAYDEPNGNQVTTLKFSMPYYVVREKDDWLELVDATVDKLEIKKLRAKIGWVRKNDLLLWNESLINPRTKIHLKALLLNKYDNFKDIPCDKKELVKVYTSPTGSSLKEDLNIYKFYFIYKKEGERYLLGETSGLSFYDPSYLLGWVDRGRVADWNTRIALEPNFTLEGYSERKSNPNFQVVGFGDAILAEDFGAGKIGSDKGDWRRDPVRSGQDVAKSDPKRFPGGFMRFPLLSVGGQSKKSVLPYFKSAVCDDVNLKVKCRDGKVVDVQKMTIGKHVKVSEQLEDYARASKYFNVFFVIEGSGNMSGVKETIIQSIDEIKSSIVQNTDKASVKFGALVYRDIAEIKNNNSQSLIQVTKLTPDQQSVKDWIRRATFSNPGSNGDYPAQNYGIYNAITAAAFPKNETNIIIVLGQKGDFARDPLLRKQHAGKSYNVPNASIEDLVMQNDVNVIAVQCVGGNTEPDRAFTNNLQSIIIQGATKHANNLKVKIDKNQELKDALAKINYTPQAPLMDDPDETQEPLLVLKNGTLNSSIYRLSASGAITPDNFNKLLISQGAVITKEAVKFTNKVESWNYREIDGEGFNPRLSEALAELFEVQNLDDSFTDEKYELYKPMYFSRKPKDAVNPTFSFVLFWPERDLKNYKSFLERLIIDISNVPSMSQKRIKLQDAYCKLLDQFAGGDNGKDCTEYTIEEIVELIQGVKDEGVDFSSQCISNKPLKCIVDKDCTTDEDVETLIRCFSNSKKTLDRMLQNYESEEFVFSRGGEYFFWIKLTDLF